MKALLVAFSLLLLTSDLYAAKPEQRSTASDTAVAKLEGLLLEAVRHQNSTPPVLSDDEAVKSSSGDVSLTGVISRASAPYDLGRYGDDFRGFAGRTAVLRNGGNIAFTITCLVDLGPCEPKTEGMWTITPAYDERRTVIYWLVSHYSPLTLKLLEQH